jgi:hypothetical protein
MSEKKPQPLIPARVHNRCPVCGEISYSRAGVHPQCWMRQADEKRKIRIKREKLLAKEEKAPTTASGSAPWQKNCPKCNALQHVRKTVCGCGHTFTASARPPTYEGGRP